MLGRFRAGVGPRSCHAPSALLPAFSFPDRPPRSRGDGAKAIRPGLSHARDPPLNAQASRRQAAGDLGLWAPRCGRGCPCVLAQLRLGEGLGSLRRPRGVDARRLFPSRAGAHQTGAWALSPQWVLCGVVLREKRNGKTHCAHMKIRSAPRKQLAEIVFVETPFPRAHRTLQ